MTRPGTTEALTRFDPLAESYDAWFETPIGTFVESQETAMLHRLVAPRPGQRLLEVGSGTGYFLRALAQSGARCVGIEPSAEMLAVASRAEAGRIDNLRGRGESLPFGPATFDCVAYVTTLEFVADPAEAVREAARVCRPGGRIVCVVLNSRGPWFRQRQAEGGLWNTTHFYSAEELVTLLQPLGNVEIDYRVHLPPSLDRLPAVLMGLLDTLLRSLRRRDGALIGAMVKPGENP